MHVAALPATVLRGCCVVSAALCVVSVLPGGAWCECCVNGTAQLLRCAGCGCSCVTVNAIISMACMWLSECCVNVQVCSGCENVLQEH